MTLLVKRLHKDAIIPTKGSKFSAGWDLYCIESVDIPPGRRATLPTGLAFAIPTGFYGRIAPRSGLGAKYGYNIHAGVVDPDYRGEVKVALINHGDDTIEFRKGDRIAQMILTRYDDDPGIVEMNDLGESDRGAAGFGSTGR